MPPMGSGRYGRRSPEEVRSMEATQPPSTPPPPPPTPQYPVALSVEYPDRDLDRVSTAFRIFAVIPIAIVLGSIGGYSGEWANGGGRTRGGGGGTRALFIPPPLRIPFRG